MLFFALEARLLFLASPRKSKQKEGDPASAPAAPVPCATRSSRALRNSGLRALRQSSRLSAKPSVARRCRRDGENQRAPNQPALHNVWKSVSLLVPQPKTAGLTPINPTPINPPINPRKWQAAAIRPHPYTAHRCNAPHRPLPKTPCKTPPGSPACTPCRRSCSPAAA